MNGAPHPRAQRSRRQALGLRAFFVISLAAGISALFVSVAYSLRILDDAEQTLPSLIDRDIATIAEARVLRSDLGQVDRMLSEATEGHPWEPGAMRRVLEEIDRERSTSARNVVEDGEVVGRAAALDAVARVRPGIDDVRTLLDAGRRDDAKTAWHATVGLRLQYADAALERFLKASLADIADAASAQGRLRHRAIREALLVDALCALVAIALGVSSYRVARKQERALHARLAELELFSDRVAHEIRGPLTPVSFALQEASRGATEPLRGFLARGERSLRVVLQIVDGLHAFARSHLPPRGSAAVEVRPVVENVLADAMSDAEAADVQLAIGTLDDTVVACDEGVLSSILSNLVRNAIRYMGDEPLRRVTVHVRAGGARARILVEDTGPGLPPGFEARAFLPYSRPPGQVRSGLGLGLATVKGLAERAGGSVGVNSTVSGCTFAVDLPTSHPALVPAEEALRA